MPRETVAGRFRGSCKWGDRHIFVTLVGDLEDHALTLAASYRVLPIVALLLLCSFLDRTNIGNAKILGLERDLNLTDAQYSHGLAVFYATYVAWLVATLPMLKFCHLKPCRGLFPQR